MKVGIALDLEINKEIYMCKIIDLNKDELIIDYPIHKKTKRTYYPSTGIVIAANYIERNQAVYKFTTKILRRKKGKIPALVLERPKGEEVKRIQRRQYVRIDTTLDVALHAMDDAFQPFTTVTSDISGGGMAVIVPNHRFFEIDSQIEVWVVVPSKEEQSYIKVVTEVIAEKEHNQKFNTLSLRFLHIDDKDRQEIIQYTFRKQREMRMKERM